ncbi:thiocillin family RiPP [Streptomyces sp. NBC_01077]|nr:thiocillin family RiPP [Streptomyces sp. NBC_01077]WSV44353.1 thiocillin family RiPP [Streptomyces sp. NBC_01077]
MESDLDLYALEDGLGVEELPESSSLSTVSSAACHGTCWGTLTR